MIEYRLITRSGKSLVDHEIMGRHVKLHPNDKNRTCVWPTFDDDVFLRASVAPDTIKESEIIYLRSVGIAYYHLIMSMTQKDRNQRCKELKEVFEQLEKNQGV